MRFNVTMEVCCVQNSTFCILKIMLAIISGLVHEDLKVSTESKN